MRFDVCSPLSFSTEVCHWSSCQSQTLYIEEAEEDRKLLICFWKPQQQLSPCFNVTLINCGSSLLIGFGKRNLISQYSDRYLPQKSVHQSPHHQGLRKARNEKPTDHSFPHLTISWWPRNWSDDDQFICALQSLTLVTLVWFFPSVSFQRADESISTELPSPTGRHPAHSSSVSSRHKGRSSGGPVQVEQ